MEFRGGHFGGLVEDIGTVFVAHPDRTVGVDDDTLGVERQAAVESLRHRRESRPGAGAG